MTAPVSSALKAIKAPVSSAASASGAMPVAITPTVDLEFERSCNCVCCPVFAKKGMSPGVSSPDILRRAWTWRKDPPVASTASAVPPRKSVAAHVVDRSKESPAGFEPDSVGTGLESKVSAIEFLRSSEVEGHRFDPVDPPFASNVLAASALPSKKPATVSKTSFPDF